MNRVITESFRHLTGPSGGVLYHASALRYRRTLWPTFLLEVKSWLENWSPKEKHLLLYGSSAGWTLPESFLTRFESICVVEPDPLARFLLKKRFPGVRKWEFELGADLLPWFSHSRSRFQEFLTTKPNHAILFSNLLGQVPLLLPEKLTPRELQHRQDEFLLGLAGRTWASYHDLFSTRSTRPLQINATNIQPEPEESLDSLASRIFPAGSEIREHETHWLTGQGPMNLAFWQIRPGSWHLIAFTARKSS